MKTQIIFLMRRALLFALLVTVNAGFLLGQGNMWYEVTSPADVTQRIEWPAAYRISGLDGAAMQNAIQAAPSERNVAARNSNVVVTLPMPDGTMMDFTYVNSPVMEPELAAKFPEVSTFAGRSVTDPAVTVRFGWTLWGFHAIILNKDKSVFIEPLYKGNTSQYIIYESDMLRIGPDRKFCGIETESAVPGPIINIPEVASGAQLRTYRLAVAATGEYTAINGPGVANVISAIAAVINQVTAIYEAEVAIRFVLIGDNDRIIFTNAATDPYTNTGGNPCSTNLRTENQTAIDDSIGDAGYDIGHLFIGTNIGGCASFAVVCSNGSKARGVSGVTNGGAFDVGLTCHEMGHQFNAQHTFNSSIGSCLGGQYAAGAAYEPGSGSTIMSYAGTCHMIQSFRDMQFHTKSYDEIVAFSTGGGGNSCPVNTNTGNTPPTVDAGAGGFTIPINTPFTLSGSGNDADGDALTFSWEQFDLGPQGDPDAPSGNAPIFRSFPPVNSASRTFPRLSDILNNTQTTGEILPSYGRSLSFRLTARDNRLNGGGVEYDGMSFNVDGGSGPFEVTSPNSFVSWCAGESRTITWDVANTNNPPINTANVRILLSTNGGTTFPVTILASTANDGSEQITVPDNPVMNNARIKIEAIGNVYFDISDADFTINSPPVVTLNPADAVKEFGDDVDFVATASGSPVPSVQWQISENGGPFSDMPGENSTTLSLTCLVLSQSGNQYRAVFTNVCGSDTTDAATLTVNPRTTTATVTITPNPQQYSDKVTFDVLIANAVICGEQAATGGTIYIGTQNMGAVVFSINGMNLEASLADIPLLEPVPFGTPPTGNMAPGDHEVRVVFDGLNPNFSVQDAVDTLTIEPEDARAYYTGACFASTLNAGTSNAIVTLAATIKDITAVTGDADWDSCPGDIRNATVTFINRDNNTVIASNVPIGLVSQNNTMVAVAVYNWNTVIAGNSQSFTIGIIVGGYYIRNSAEDNTIVTVSKPVSDFVTGGGYIVLANSAGTIAGDAGTKSNFGYSVKFNKKGTNLQGSINMMFRRSESDGLHTYQVKGNSFTSLAVQKTLIGGQATINSKANITDITSGIPVGISGNNILQIKMADMGEPGSGDSISLTIWNKNGGLIYSSYWDGTRTLQQLIDAGNLKVHTSNTFSRIYNEFGEENLSVFPNPSSGNFMLSYVAAENESCNINLVDMKGGIVMTDFKKSTEGINTFEYDLDYLNDGIYYLRLDTETIHDVFKIIIAH